MVDPWTSETWNEAMMLAHGIASFHGVKCKVYKEGFSWWTYPEEKPVTKRQWAELCPYCKGYDGYDPEPHCWGCKGGRREDYVSPDHVVVPDMPWRNHLWDYGLDLGLTIPEIRSIERAINVCYIQQNGSHPSNDSVEYLCRQAAKKEGE